MIDLRAQIVGAEQLDQALASGPQDASAATERGLEQARPIFASAIEAHTPVKSGLLRSQDEVFTEKPMLLTFRNVTFYAGFVVRHNPFVDLGVGDAEAAGIAAVEGELNTFAVRFGGH